MHSWLRWYGGALGIIAALSFVTAAVFGLHVLRCTFVYCALFFLAASVDRPHAAFLMLRNTGWFTYIREDFIVRWIILVIGLWLAAMGMFIPWRTA